MINDETRDAACLRNRTTYGRISAYARRSFVFARGRQGVRRDEESTVTSPQGPRENVRGCPRAFLNFRARCVAMIKKRYALSRALEKKAGKDISTWSYVWMTSYRGIGEMLRTLDACRMRYIARWRQRVIMEYWERWIRMLSADTGDAEE